MIGGVVVESVVNISNRGSNIENQTEHLKYVSPHPLSFPGLWLQVYEEQCGTLLITDVNIWIVDANG